MILLLEIKKASELIAWIRRTILGLKSVAGSLIEIENITTWLVFSFQNCVGYVFLNIFILFRLTVENYSAYLVMS